MEIDARDVMFAVYHAGGATAPIDGPTVATYMGATIEQVDPPLADAVEKGLLSRVQDEASGRVAFRLTADGLADVEAGSG